MRQVFIILIAVFSVLYACAQQQNVEYQYDNLNRLTTVVYPDGTIINYTFDANGNRLSKTVIAVSQLPSVETAAITQVGSSLAVGGGNVISDGGTALTARGICWSTIPNPTISNFHSTDGGTTGSFVSSLTNLTPNTTYYVRAYATNSVGTAYGQEVNFTTDCNQVAVLIVGNSSIDFGESVTLTASGGSSYSWNTGQSGSSIIVTPAATTTYTVTGTNAYGCLGTASKTVSVNTTITLQLAHSICEGQSYDFYGESLSVAGTYTHLLQGGACDTLITLHLSVMESPVLTISGRTSICEGESTTLSVDGADTYLWADGTTEEETTVTTAGTYGVFGYNESTGCYGIAHVSVSVWQPAATSFIVQTANCYDWNGELYCRSGVYTQYLETIHGCDSVVTLYLIIEENDDVVYDDDSVEDDDTVEDNESVEDNDEEDGENTVEGVNENTGNIRDFTAYPNPTLGIVNVRLISETNNLKSEIAVFDVYGKLLDIVAVSDNSSLQIAQIDLSRCTSGVYILKLVNNGEVLAVRKVVKR